jgi:lactoylglutathione lyase
VPTASGLAALAAGDGVQLFVGSRLEARLHYSNNAKEIHMPRIVHIAAKTDELDRAADFYEKVFGFAPTGKSRSEDRTRRRVTDGEIDLTFLKYDSEEAEFATAAGEGPRIHHFAVEVDDLEKYVKRAREFGCEILSKDTTMPPVKLRIPGGPIMEIVPEARYRKSAKPD